MACWVVLEGSRRVQWLDAFYAKEALLPTAPVMRMDYESLGS